MSVFFTPEEWQKVNTLIISELKFANATELLSASGEALRILGGRITTAIMLADVIPEDDIESIPGIQVTHITIARPEAS